MNFLRIIAKIWDKVTKRILNSACKKLWPECVLGHHLERLVYQQWPLVVDKIVSLGKTMEWEMNEDDIQEKIEE